MKFKNFTYIGLFISSIAVNANNDLAIKCTAIENPDTRLKCYDSIFKKDSKAAIPNYTIKSNPPVTEKISKSIPQTTANKAAKKMPPIFKSQEKKQEEDKIKVTGKITRITQLPSYKLDITLDNGQVWRTNEGIYRSPLKKSQEVQISEAVFSGYILRVTGSKVSLRVNRVK